MYFISPRRSWILRSFRWCPATPPLLRLSHRPPLLHSFKGPACSLHFTSRASSLSPYNAKPPTPRAISISSRTTSWQGFRRKQSHQQPGERRRKSVSQFSVSQKMRMEMCPPHQRERGRVKSERRLNRREACDRSLFYPSSRDTGFLCLIHSWTVSDSNSYLFRDAVKHIRIEWFVLLTHTYRWTHTPHTQHLHFSHIEYQLYCRTFYLWCCLKLQTCL